MAAIQFGEAAYDDCGVCGGDNSHCNDCAGVPHGPKRLDHCGVCDTDAADDCTTDCAGVWGAALTRDACGMCNGTADCMDCQGRLHGKSYIDNCDTCDDKISNDCVAEQCEFLESTPISAKYEDCALESSWGYTYDFSAHRGARHYNRALIYGESVYAVLFFFLTPISSPGLQRIAHLSGPARGG